MNIKIDAALALGAASPLEALVDVFCDQRKAASSYGSQFYRAVTWMRRVLRRRPCIIDLRPETLALYRSMMIEMGLAEDYADKMLTRVITLWNFAARKGLAAECSYSRGRKPGPEPLPPPIGDPGTLLALFYERYVPERGTSSSQFAHYLATFRKLREALGRDVRPGELNANVIVMFRSHLAGLKLKPLTIRTNVQRLLAVWRFAQCEGLATPVPPMPRQRIPRDVPDAWSVEEFGRIVEAAARLGRPPIGGVPTEKYWPAILLVAYYTALRRGTLLRLRPADIDLDAAAVRVPGEMMKNRIGQVFRVGSEAVAALREIWDDGRERIFPSPADGRTLAVHFHLILRAAGVAANTTNRMSLFHKVRRTAVTQTAVNAGMAEAIALAGHSGPRRQSPLYRSLVFAAA